MTANTPHERAPQPPPSDVDRVAEVISARLHVTTDTWTPARLGAAQYRPAISADTTSVREAAAAILATADADAITAIARHYARIRPDLLHAALNDTATTPGPSDPADTL